MRHARIAIIGGGLSGLHAAALLEERGIQDYVVLEARETFGGRIISWPDISTTHENELAEVAITGRFDLGATWYWPAMHPALQRLVQQLGLETFQQHEHGEMLIERSRVHVPARVDGFVSAPPALRLVGGMSALVEVIRTRLSADQLLSGRQVTGMRLFVRLLGDTAAQPKAEFLKGWTSAPYTAVAGNGNPYLNHPIPPPARSTEEPWGKRLVGIASEWSPNFSGYAAGAIEAAQLGVSALLAPKTAASVLH